MHTMMISFENSMRPEIVLMQLRVIMLIILFILKTGNYELRDLLNSLNFIWFWGLYYMKYNLISFLLFWEAFGSFSAMTRVEQKGIDRTTPKIDFCNLMGVVQQKIGSCLWITKQFTKYNSRKKIIITVLWLIFLLKFKLPPKFSRVGAGASLVTFIDTENLYQAGMALILEFENEELFARKLYGRIENFPNVYPAVQVGFGPAAAQFPYVFQHNLQNINLAKSNNNGFESQGSCFFEVKLLIILMISRKKKMKNFVRGRFEIPIISKTRTKTGKKFQVLTQLGKTEKNRNHSDLWRIQLLGKSGYGDITSIMKNGQRYRKKLKLLNIQSTSLILRKNFYPIILVRSFLDSNNFSISFRANLTGSLERNVPYAMRVISKSDLKIKTNSAAHIITKISDKLFKLLKKPPLNIIILNATDLVFQENLAVLLVLMMWFEKVIILNYFFSSQPLTGRKPIKSLPLFLLRDSSRESYTVSLVTTGLVVQESQGLSKKTVQRCGDDWININSKQITNHINATHFGCATHRKLQSWSRWVAEPICSTQMRVTVQISKISFFPKNKYFNIFLNPNGLIYFRLNLIKPCEQELWKKKKIQRTEMHCFAIRKKSIQRARCFKGLAF
ncbi:hypothetical protein VP01_757g2 [Puccinia sorghi]|uniref:Uncharacterized protein n=1 Tax=Puccinia sorghi TaxID=27349 RepID=A0A0L6UCV0_9BASI|nr:hypothetical protein VP01_757g2 [Puccinia sorghi]